MQDILEAKEAGNQLWVLHICLKTSNHMVFLKKGIFFVLEEKLST